MQQAQIRYAQLDDAESASRLAWRAKSGWGYSTEWLELWRQSLTITSEACELTSPLWRWKASNLWASASSNHVVAKAPLSASGLSPHINDRESGGRWSSERWPQRHQAVCRGFKSSPTRLPRRSTRGLEPGAGAGGQHRCRVRLSERCRCWNSHLLIYPMRPRLNRLAEIAQ